MITYFNAIPIKSLKKIITLGLCLHLSACQYLTQFQSRIQGNSSAILVKSTPVQEAILKIASAEYDLLLNTDRHSSHKGTAQHKHEQTVTVKARFSLTPLNSNPSKYFQFTLKKILPQLTIDQNSDSCAEQKSQDPQYIVFQCLQENRKEHRLELSYDLPISLIQGYQPIFEVERSYHLFWPLDAWIQQKFAFCAHLAGVHHIYAEIW